MIARISWYVRDKNLNLNENLNVPVRDFQRYPVTTILLVLDSTKIPPLGLSRS